MSSSAAVSSASAASASATSSSSSTTTHVSVRSPSMLVTPICDRFTTIGSMHTVRFNGGGAGGGSSHLVVNRLTSLDLYGIEWNQSDAVTDDTGDHSMMDTEAQESTDIPTLRLVAEPAQPLLGCIMQIATLPTGTSTVSAASDLLLVTSTSGFLSLLSCNDSSVASASFVLPNIKSPIRVHLNGVIQSLNFLPSRSALHARLLVAYRPHTPTSPSDAMSSAGASASTANASRPQPPQLLLLEVDLKSGAVEKKQYPMQLKVGDVVNDILLVNRPPNHSASSSAAYPSAATNPSTSSSRRRLTPIAHTRISESTRGGLAVRKHTFGSFLRVSQTGNAVAVASREGRESEEEETNEGGILIFPISTQSDSSSSMMLDTSSASASSSSSAAAPTFVLLSLLDRVILFDLDSKSSLRFPIELPLPVSEDAAPLLSSSSSSSSSRGMSGWTWLQDRLICATESGDVYYLHLWFNTHQNPVEPDDTRKSEWARFVSLGLATPCTSLVGFSTPKSSAASALSDFLLITGTSADGMLARIDWKTVTDAIQVADKSASLLIVPADSALHRQEQSIPNLSELHDFIAADVLPSVRSTVTAPSTSSVAPHRSSPHFLLCGHGVHGSVRVTRPGMLQAELTSSPTADSKVHHGLITLNCTSTSGAVVPGVLSSFFGSTRVSMLRDTMLDDTTDELITAGFEANQTTLSAGFYSTPSQQVLLQITPQAVRAVHVLLHATNAGDEFKSAGAFTQWQPQSAAAPSSSSSSNFTSAYIYSNFILLSLSSSRKIVLLEYQPGNGFLVRAEAALTSDISCIYIAPVRSSATPTASNLLCFVGTHDCNLHVYSVPAAYQSSSPIAFRLEHSFLLTNYLPAETAISAIAESILLCGSATPSSTPSLSTSTSPSRFYLYLGLRDGSLIRSSFSPTSVRVEDTLFKQTLVHRLGSAPLKLSRMDDGSEGAECHILAMTNSTYLIATQGTGFDVREICWPWYTDLSSSLQFACAFPTLTQHRLSAGVVVEGRFYMMEIDTLAHGITTFAIEATPKAIVHHPESNLLCVVTNNLDAKSAAGSQLLLLDPFSGAILDRYAFGTDAKTGMETAQSIAVWKTLKETYIAVGTVSPISDSESTTNTNTAAAAASSSSITGASTSSSKSVASSGGSSPGRAGSVHLFTVLRSSNQNVATDLTTTPMQLDGSDASSSSAPTTPPYRLHREQVLSDLIPRGPKMDHDANSGVTAIVAFDPMRLLYSLNGSMRVATINLKGEFVLVSTTLGSLTVPIHSISVDPLDSTENKAVVRTDSRYGVTLQRIDRTKYALDSTDPYARLARQAVVYSTKAILADSSTFPKNTTAARVKFSLFNPPPSLLPSSSAVATTNEWITNVIRILGFDAFGNLFLLRREPQPTTGSSSSSSASSTTSSNSSVPGVISPALVQECSFLLPSVASRIRAIQSRRRPTSLHTYASQKEDAAADATTQQDFVLSTRLGALHLVSEVSSADAIWLHALQHRLAQSPQARSLLANDHASYRGAPYSDLMIDGELLASFLFLTTEQQQQLCGNITSIQGVPLFQVVAYLQQLLRY